ncbi:MAG: NADH-quinone oxidoreductase subunit L [Firmicutes bacterium]|nr:NADH-quinone oxidoreductase subunit L [Bacillota bacterium]
MLEHIWIVPALPLASWLVITFFNRRLGPRAAHVGTAAVLTSLVLSVAAFIALVARGGEPVTTGGRWLTLGPVAVDMGLAVDNLAAIMLLVVSIVSSAVHIYSMGYMHGDRRYQRFFGTLSLFTSAMLLLVLADNYLLLLIAWEVMGLCSYLLIGHWFEEDWPRMASMKAFMTTRVGDVAMLIGIFLLYTNAGTFNIAAITKAAAEGALAPTVVTAGALLLFGGAVGKSAQFPLHVWLPDAMAGPTPVSALIHAATMVAAGVYLVARSFGIFVASGDALFVVALIGGFTALFAATIATLQTDFKKVLAYSTVSQLGYMMLGLGVGGYVAGTFHLVTHAFFKALLFLTAGSVSHALGTLEIHRMGGLAGKMKVTFWTFLAGALALAGIPPLAGFWSKDEILVAAWGSGWTVLFWMAVATAFLTAYYMTRLTVLVFFGRPRDHHAYEHAHESPRVMTGPLVALSVLAVLGGLPGSPWAGHWLGHFLDFGRSLPGLEAATGHAHGAVAHGAELASHAAGAAHAAGPVLPIALGAALLGILVGYLVYGTRLVRRERVIRALRPIYLLLKNKYYVDELYSAALVRPAVRLAELCGLFDNVVVDGAVNGVAWATREMAFSAGEFDNVVVDGAVNGVANGTVAAGRALRRAHTGNVRSYMVALYAGAAASLAVLVWLLI